MRAIGGSSGRGLGVEPLASSGESESSAGEGLRVRLLDPILAACRTGTRTLYLSPDDLLYLVPFDALPIGGERIGDRYRIALQGSFAFLGALGARSEGARGLLAVGDIDYGAAPVPERIRLAESSAPIELAYSGWRQHDLRQPAGLPG